MSPRLLLVACLAAVAMATPRTSLLTGSCKPGWPFMKGCNVCWCTPEGMVGGCTNNVCGGGGTAPADEGHNSTSTLPKEQNVYIVNGQDAKVGQFPYQGFVLASDTFACSGSLISKLSVLTAGHCTFGHQTLSIRLGGIHRIHDEETAWTVVSRKAETHPQYNENGHWNNDIAVIFLPKEAPLSDYIKLVALPSLQEINESFVGLSALVSGWGYTSAGAACSEILKWTEMNVISNIICKVYYEPGVVIESTLCTFSSNSSTCSGDSGAGLVLKTPGGYKQIGVLNFGPPQCQTDVPVGFARVTYHLLWIARTAGISVL